MRCIREAVGAFVSRGWEFELIVCDNNSSDRTAELARAEGAVVVFEPVNQIARARNAGAAVATGDWLLFVDADSFPNRALFAGVAEQIQIGRCLGGGATIQLDESRPLLNVLTGGWNLLSRATKWVAGSFIFCEAAAFRQIGGFSIEFFAGEELDLSKRLKTLARAQKRTMVILRCHPLLTSARKARLYSVRELGRVLLRAAFMPRRLMRNRAECAMWYDGRR